VHDEIVCIWISHRFKGPADAFAVNVSAKLMLDKNKYPPIKHVTLPIDKDRSEGEKFWGCTAYPICRVTRPFNGWINQE